MLDILLVIIEQSLMHLPLVLGAYISFSLLKVPDLSIESAYVVGAVFGSQLLLHATQLPLLVLCIGVLLASCLGGALVGVVSSVLTQKGKLPHLLSSIITSGLFHGINQFISPVYVSLSGAPNQLTLLYGSIQHPELPMLFVIGLLVFGAIALLFATQLGYAYAVYGDNPQFFSNYGISTAYVFITGIMLANALSGLSGYLFAQSNSFLELNMGYAKALFCITALILGKSIVRNSKAFSALIPLAGTVAYFVLQQLLIKVGFNLKYFTAVQACIVAAIVLYSYRTTSTRSMRDNLGV